MPASETTKIVGQSWPVYRLKGTVVGAQRHVTTQVSGGGGHFTPEHGGTIAPVVAANSIHDTLYIRDGDQREHAVRLTDVQVDCREGHQLEIAGPLDGAEPGYLVVLNQTTATVHGAPCQIRRFHQPSTWRVAGWTLLLGVALPYLAVQLLASAGRPRSLPMEIFFGVLGVLLLHRYWKGRSAVRQVMDQAVFFKS
jgi:hypothetical protein